MRKKNHTHLYIPSQWINPFHKFWLASNCSHWYFLGTWWKLSLSFTTAAKESPESRMFMHFLHPTKTGLILVKIHSYAICRARTVSSSADVYRYARWSVARAFAPIRFLNSVSGLKRSSLYFKWSKTLEHLNLRKVFFKFLQLLRYFWLFLKVWRHKWHLFLVTTLKIW